MTHEKFQKIVEDYANEHGFKIYVAVHRNNVLESFGDDILQQYFQGLMNDRKLAEEWLKKKRNQTPFEDLGEKAGVPLTDADITGGRKGEDKCG